MIEGFSEKTEGVRVCASYVFTGVGCCSSTQARVFVF
jgi:hypothetical protein